MSDVLSAIRAFGFKENEKHIAVALSGGADSMALLTGLYMLKDELGISLSALHLNHCLRGEEALRDENFVRKECERLNIPLTVKRENVAEYAAKTGQSIELAAREVRYAFFAESGGQTVATAHNADDNVETVLYRLTRSTGISGLCGIPKRRGIFIRPLLQCSREEIECFLKENAVSFVTDSTNLSDDYTRNKLRHNVVPVLKELNPSLCKSFGQTLSLISDDSDFLKNTAQQEFLRRINDGRLFVKDFHKLHRAIASRVISLFLDSYNKESNNYCVTGVLETVLKGEGRFQLKGGEMVKVQKDFLYIEDSCDAPTFNTLIVEENIESIKKNGKIHNLLLKNSLDCDKIVGKLILRTRVPGDKITFSHRKVSKPLTKWMNEEGIDSLKRETLPVIADGAGVVWVYGGGVDARVCPDDNTKRIYRVYSKQIGGK